MIRLADFSVLTFDCYGTLIDWEAGIAAALAPVLSRTAYPPDREAALGAFGRLESAQEAATPAMRYPDILAAVHRKLGAELGVVTTSEEDARFGASVGDWPAFPDSADSLRRLQRFYKLVILSNVDRESFARSQARLGVTFDAVFTAEDIGSYKPDPANFRYLLDHVGTPQSAILHTAQSLFHDHAPAQALDLRTCWIDRRHAAGGWGATSPQAGARYDVRFTSLAEMAGAREAEG